MRSRSRTKDLLQSLVAEASTESGTWKMETYNRLIDCVRLMKPKDADELICGIMQPILSPQTAQLTRYKLSQACSIINSKKIPSFEGKFLPYKEAITELCAKIGDAELGPAIIQHLRGLYAEKTQRPASITPQPTVIPTKEYSPSNGRYVITSHSPDP